MLQRGVRRILICSRESRYFVEASPLVVHPNFQISEKLFEKILAVETTGFFVESVIIIFYFFLDR